MCREPVKRQEGYGKGKGLEKDFWLQESKRKQRQRKAQKDLNIKKCQGSQRSKTTNIIREFTDERIGREENVFPSLLTGCTSPLCLTSFILSETLPSILSSPLEMFLWRSLHLHRFPHYVPAPPPPSHPSTQARSDLSPLPLPSASFCQLMNHRQVHDTKTEQFTFKENAPF